jgi:hypothetical protein
MQLGLYTRVFTRPVFAVVTGLLLFVLLSRRLRTRAATREAFQQGEVAAPTRVIAFDRWLQGRTAHAQAGVTWGELDRETQAFGLATTGGTDPTTGIAGLTLGGGLGWWL